MPKVLGIATDDKIVEHQNRVRLEAEQYGKPAFHPKLTSAFGDGIASMGEYYVDGDGRYCRGPRHCRADATVARLRKKESVPV